MFPQVVLQLSQFSSPLTACFTVCTGNIKLVEWPFQALVWEHFKVVFPACWTGFVLILDLFSTCVAETGSTTFGLVWVSEYQAAYWAVCLKGTCRLLNKLAIISSKHLHLLWPVISFCSSLSSLWYLGEWSFLLLVYDICMYICMYVCMYVCLYVQTTELHHSYSLSQLFKHLWLV